MRPIMEVQDYQELKLFLGLPFFSWDSDPFSLCNSQKEILTGLSKLAIGYLIIPGSSVRSDRLFYQFDKFKKMIYQLYDIFTYFHNPRIDPAHGL